LDFIFRSRRIVPSQFRSKCIIQSAHSADKAALNAGYDFYVFLSIQNSVSYTYLQFDKAVAVRIKSKFLHTNKYTNKTLISIIKSLFEFTYTLKVIYLRLQQNMSFRCINHRIKLFVVLFFCNWFQDVFTKFSSFYFFFFYLNFDNF